MRGLSLLDVLVILAVLALLVLASRFDAARFAAHTRPVAPGPTPSPATAS
jgi:hypothetical protein